MIYEESLPIQADASTTGYLRGVDNEGKSILLPMTVLGAGGGAATYEYLGKAYIATNPSTPSIKGYYICSDNGTYTDFGNQDARSLDRFYWNGSSWDLHEYSEHLDVKTIKDGDILKQVVWNGSAWETTGTEWVV